MLIQLHGTRPSLTPFLTLSLQPELAAHNLSACKKTVGSTMTQLLTAASEGNEDYTGRAARETANALRDFTGAVRSVAATTNDRSAQHA